MGDYQPIMIKIKQMTDTDSYPVIQIGVIQMQIGNLNIFGYDRMRMDQDLPYSYGGQIFTQLLTPDLQ